MTKKKLFDTLISIIAAVAALFVSGCGGDDAPGEPAAQPGGPSGAAAFVGATIEINPSVAFFTGGLITYYNVVASTTFPTASIPVGGTYTYTPGALFWHRRAG